MFAIRSHEMRKMDQFMIETIGLPSLVLMENAAKAVVEEIEGSYPKEKMGTQRILILCGLGNNGGDGLAVARWLFHRGYLVQVVVLGNVEQLSKDAKNQYDILSRIGKELLILEEASEDNYKRIQDEISKSSLIIDAIYGSGCNRKISSFLHQIITMINQSQVSVFSVDVPSGIHGDNGKVMGNAVIAERTITFCLPKIGLLMGEGPLYSGNIVIKDIGIIEKAFYEVKGLVEVLDESYLLQWKLKLKRSMNTHKGSYGIVGIIAGTTQMQGATLLAAKAAYRAGAGLVKIFCQEEYKTMYLSAIPEAVLVCYDKEKDFEESLEITVLEQFLSSVDVLLIGQGLSQNQLANDFLELVLKSRKKVVFDADALNLLATNMERFELRECQAIVTPHIGEMSRMTAYPSHGILENTLQFAEAFSKKYQAVCVLKNHRTIISDFLGRCSINITGNPGMATAGSGDVLAGIIVGLLAQGLSLEDSASLGVSLHAASGDYTKTQIGEQAIMALDLVQNLWKTR